MDFDAPFLHRHAIVALLCTEVAAFKNDIIKTWQRGFHLGCTFLLCCLFPSLSLSIFHFAKSPAVSGYLGKDDKQAATSETAACFPALSPGCHWLQTTRLSQHGEIKSAKNYGLSACLHPNVCWWVCGWACLPEKMNVARCVCEKLPPTKLYSKQAKT